MELINEFRVDADAATAWQVLTDVERIAPCMPGAQLQEIEGDEYRGVVKVKVGPITAQYKGVAQFVEQDADARRAVLHAQGRDTRGQGNATATITASLVSDGSGTKVSVVTDLTVTGKVAQFGRGVMADVSAKLLDQFVTCLESTVLSSDGVPTNGAAADTGVVEGSVEENEPPVRTISSPDPQPVDLLQTAGAPVVKRIAPILAIVALGWLVRVLLKRRKK